MRATTCVLAMVWSAAASAHAQQGSSVPIRKLGPAEAFAKDTLDASTLVRPMSNGNVFVIHRNRVMLYDSTLTLIRVAADSTSLTPGPRRVFFAATIPYLADSLLVVDVNASAFLLIDPQGKIVRPMAAPKTNDVNYLTQLGPRVTSDPSGRLIYRAGFPRPPLSATTTTTSAPEDTFPIVRANFDTRSVDTVAVVKSATGLQISTSIDNGRLTMRTIRQPYPVTDGWAALSDGTIAIIRGNDYHVDWIGPDGAKTSAPKLPFDWRRITDDEKIRIVDSLKVVQAASDARLDSMNRANNVVRPSTVTQTTEIVPPSQLPDYYPPVRDGTVRADPDGNVWILPTTSLSAQGGLLYDVTNRRGDVHRVQLPPTCALSGLGRGGVVYLICGGTRLERRRIVN